MPIKGKYISRDQFERNLGMFAHATAKLIQQNPQIMQNVAENFRKANQKEDNPSLDGPETQEQTPKVS